MTRRGSLAYYLAAWIVGGFFMTASTFLIGEIAAPQESLGAGGRNWASTFLTAYFFTLMFGAAMAILYAFLLRYVMARAGWAQVWQWVAAGSALVVPLFFAVRWARHARSILNLFPTPALLLFGGGMVGAAQENRMLAAALLAGACTSAVLSLIDRAFANES